MRRTIEFFIFLILLMVLLYVGRPRLATFYYNQGLDYYRQGAYEQAIESLLQSIKIYPHEAVSHYILAETYFKRQLFDKAIAEAKKSIEIDPLYIDAYQLISQTFTSRQMYEEAISFLNQAPAEVSSRVEFKRVLEAVTFEYMADCLYQGVNAFLVQDRGRAYELLARALELKPNFAYVHYMLGYFNYVDEDYQEAREYLNRAIEIDSKFWPAYRLLGEYYFNRGEYEAAMRNFKAVINSGHEDASILNNLGLSLMEMERYPEALTYLRRALNLEPENINIRYSLASVYRDNEMLEEAISEYKKLINIDPTYPAVHNDLGDIYIRQGKEDMALAEYRKEIENQQRKLLKYPQDLYLLNALAYAYNGIGEHQKAKEIIEKVIAKRPDYRDAYITLAEIHKKLQEYDQAVNALSRAATLYKYKNFIKADIERLKKERISLSPEKRGCLDRVYLRNGRTLEGRIREETPERVVIEIYLGNSRGLISLYHYNILNIVRCPD